MSKLVRFAKDESGATAIEYGLLAVGIGLTLIVSAGYVADGLTSLFTKVQTELKK